MLSAVALGQLVPSGRAAKAQAEAEQWHRAYDALKGAYETQTAMLERAQISAEITDKVMDAVRSLQNSPKG